MEHSRAAVISIEHILKPTHGCEVHNQAGCSTWKESSREQANNDESAGETPAEP